MAPKNIVGYKSKNGSKQSGISLNHGSLSSISQGNLPIQKAKDEDIFIQDTEDGYKIDLPSWTSLRVSAESSEESSDNDDELELEGRGFDLVGSTSGKHHPVTTTPPSNKSIHRAWKDKKLKNVQEAAVVSPSTLTYVSQTKPPSPYISDATTSTIGAHTSLSDELPSVSLPHRKYSTPPTSDISADSDDEEPYKIASSSRGADVFLSLKARRSSVSRPSISSKRSLSSSKSLSSLKQPFASILNDSSASLPGLKRANSFAPPISHNAAERSSYLNRIPPKDHGVQPAATLASRSLSMAASLIRLKHSISGVSKIWAPSTLHLYSARNVQVPVVADKRTRKSVFDPRKSRAKRNGTAESDEEDISSLASSSPSPPVNIPLPSPSSSLVRISSSSPPAPISPLSPLLEKTSRSFGNQSSSSRVSQHRSVPSSPAPTHSTPAFSVVSNPVIACRTLSNNPSAEDWGAKMRRKTGFLGVFITRKPSRRVVSSTAKREPQEVQANSTRWQEPGQNVEEEPDEDVVDVDGLSEVLEDLHDDTNMQRKQEVWNRSVENQEQAKGETEEEEPPRGNFSAGRFEEDIVPDSQDEVDDGLDARSSSSPAPPTKPIGTKTLVEALSAAFAKNTHRPPPRRAYRARVLLESSDVSASASSSSLVADGHHLEGEDAEPHEQRRRPLRQARLDGMQRSAGWPGKPGRPYRPREEESEAWLEADVAPLDMEREVQVPGDVLQMNVRFAVGAGLQKNADAEQQAQDRGVQRALPEMQSTERFLETLEGMFESESAVSRSHAMRRYKPAQRQYLTSLASTPPSSDSASTHSSLIDIEGDGDGPTDANGQFEDLAFSTPGSILPQAGGRTLRMRAAKEGEEEKEESDEINMLGVPLSRSPSVSIWGPGGAQPLRFDAVGVLGKRSRTGDEDGASEGEDEISLRNPQRKRSREVEPEEEEGGTEMDVDATIQIWTAALQTLIKGKKKFSRQDMQALREMMQAIWDAREAMRPVPDAGARAELVGALRTLAAMPSEDVPFEDSEGLREGASRVLGFWKIPGA